MGRTAKIASNMALEEQLNQRYHLNVASINTFVQTSYKGAPQKITDDPAFKANTNKLKYPPYIPQIGDEVVLIKKGYSQYIKHLRRYKHDKTMVLPHIQNGWPEHPHENGPKKPKSLLCTIFNITYRLVKLCDGKVPLTVHELHFAEVDNESFTFVLDYVDIIDPMDDQFMIDKRRFDAAMKYLKTVKITRYISYPQITHRRLIHGNIVEINSKYRENYYENMHSHWKSITAKWTKNDEGSDAPEQISLWDIKQVSTLKIYKDNAQNMNSDFEKMMINRMNEFTNVPGFFQLPYLNHSSPYPAFFGLLIFRLEYKFYRQTQSFYHDFTHICAHIISKVWNDPDFAAVVKEMHNVCILIENQLRLEMSQGKITKMKLPKAIWDSLSDMHSPQPSVFGHLLEKGHYKTKTEFMKDTSNMMKDDVKTPRRKKSAPTKPKKHEHLSNNLLIPHQRYLFDGLGQPTPSPTPHSANSLRELTPPNNAETYFNKDDPAQLTKEKFSLFFIEVPPTNYVDVSIFKEYGQVTQDGDSVDHIFVAENRTPLPPNPTFPHDLTHLSLHICSNREGDSDFSLEPVFRVVCRMHIETRLSSEQRLIMSKLMPTYEASLSKVDQNHASMMLDDDDHLFSAELPDLYSHDRQFVQQYRPILSIPHLKYSRAGFFYSISHRQIQLNQSTVNTCCVHVIALKESTNVHIDGVQSFHV